MLMPTKPKHTAPKLASEPRRARRGKYDRAATGAERHQEQRLRIMDAIVSLSVAAAVGSLPSVSDVTTAAGVGRSTFYEHFDGVAEAVAAAVASEARGLVTAVLDDQAWPRTPGDYAAQVAQGWLTWCREHPQRFQLLARFGPEVLNRALLRTCQRAHRVFYAAGYSGAHIDGGLVLAAAGALAALGGAVGTGSVARAGGRDAIEPDVVESDVIAREVLLRLLR